MPEEYVTKDQLAIAIKDMEQKMENGFAEVGQQLTKILSQMDINKHTDREHNDERYVLKSEAMQDSIARINDSKFREACHPIVAGYLNTEEGKRHVGCIIDAHLSTQRDNVAKWITFAKGAVGLILALAAVYGGNTVVQTQKTTQKALINMIEQKGE